MECRLTTCVPEQYICFYFSRDHFFSMSRILIAAGVRYNMIPYTVMRSRDGRVGLASAVTVRAWDFGGKTARRDLEIERLHDVQCPERENGNPRRGMMVGT